MSKLQQAAQPFALGRSRVRGLDALCLGLVGLALSWAYAHTLAPSITWAHNGADSGDLATAAVTLGVAHPSGYPTYLLLAQPFLALPFGEPAFRTNLLSACAGLLAACCVYLLVRRLAGAHMAAGAIGGTLGALALGLAPLFWSQAIITEVYTLHALFVGLILLCIQAPARTAAGLAGQGLLLGMALGNHLTIALFGLSWLAVVLANSPAGRRLRGITAACAGLGLGLLVYGYLPLRAAAHAPINWGAPADWAGFWWLVSGALYRPLAFGVPFGQLGTRLAHAAALLYQQFGVGGLVLAGVGLRYGAAQHRRFMRLTAGLALAQVIFALCYNTIDYQTQLIPALLIVALWAGLGGAALLGGGLGSLLTVGINTLVDVRALFLILFLAGILLRQAPATARQVDISHDTTARDYAAQVLASAPPRALVLSSEDRDSFALIYAHTVLRLRPDTIVIVEPLLGFAWYRANLRSSYPDLYIPEAPRGDWRATLAHANPSRGAICRSRLDAAPPLICYGSL